MNTKNIKLSHEPQNTVLSLPRLFQNYTWPNMLIRDACHMNIASYTCQMNLDKQYGYYPAYKLTRLSRADGWATSDRNSTETMTFKPYVNRRQLFLFTAIAINMPHETCMTLLLTIRIDLISATCHPRIQHPYIQITDHIQPPPSIRLDNHACN